jgi:hypothetical protein
LSRGRRLATASSRIRRVFWLAPLSVRVAWRRIFGPATFRMKMVRNPGEFWDERIDNVAKKPATCLEIARLGAPSPCIPIRRDLGKATVPCRLPIGILGMPCTCAARCQCFVGCSDRKLPRRETSAKTIRPPTATPSPRCVFSTSHHTPYAGVEGRPGPMRTRSNPSSHSTVRWRPRSSACPSRSSPTYSSPRGNPSDTQDGRSNEYSVLIVLCSALVVVVLGMPTKPTPSWRWYPGCILDTKLVAGKACSVHRYDVTLWGNTTDRNKMKRIRCERGAHQSVESACAAAGRRAPTGGVAAGGAL